MKIELKTLLTTPTTYLYIILFILALSALTYYIYNLCKKNIKKDIVVYYIAKKEILGMENFRARMMRQDMFFGRMREAFRILQREARKRERDGDIILYGERPIFGTQAISISREIHEAIIKKLQKK